MAGWTTFQPCTVRRVACPWRPSVAASTSASRSRNHGARSCAALTRFRSTSFRSAAVLMIALAPVTRASSAVSAAVWRSFTLSGAAPHGRRAVSRRPPCGATSTRGVAPAISMSGGAGGTGGF